MTVFEQRIHAIQGKAVRVLRIGQIAGETAGRGIEIVDATAVGADPQTAIPARADGSDAVAAEAIGVSWMMLKARESQVPGIEAIQSAADGSDPDRSLPVLDNGKNIVAAEAARIVRMIAENDCLCHASC